jgi:methionyl-tRNA formyltransferase
LALLADLQPDLIVVACFPYIFPPTLLELPRYGCLNLHPSLLPAYRGPLPLFWMARQGERRAGVTLHFLDEALDTGDIVAQTAFDWPDGISGVDLERRCAEEGAKLLPAALQQLAQGGELPRRPQPQQGSSYFSWPTQQDFVIPTHWEARRAFNFLRAAVDWPLVIEVGEEMRRRGGEEAGRQGGEEAGRRGGEERFLIRAAVSFDTQAALDQPCLVRDDELWVKFTPGVLRAKI